MPMIDAFIPESALTGPAEQALLGRITDLVLEQEVGDAANPRARSASWIFVHRPAVFVGGAPASAARYRFIVSVPEGQFDDARRRAIVEGITAAVARAESAKLEDVASRVWVLASEIPDGTWGARGRVVRLPEILTALLGERGREAAVERLAKRAGWS